MFFQRSRYARFGAGERQRIPPPSKLGNGIYFWITRSHVREICLPSGFLAVVSGRCLREKVSEKRTCRGFSRASRRVRSRITTSPRHAGGLWFESAVAHHHPQSLLVRPDRLLPSYSPFVFPPAKRPCRT